MGGGEERERERKTEIEREKRPFSVIGVDSI